MIWRYANAFTAGQPINIDRVMGGSYNTRSVLETLVAHTPQFYVCSPGRIESIADRSTVKRGHKHLAWFPDDPHEPGKVVTKDVDMVISEVPGTDVIYDAVRLPDEVGEAGLDIDIVRRHAQMQIALIQIGLHLGFRTWVAQNDQGIIYKGKRLGEISGVIPRISEEKLLTSHQEAARAALMIDCIWFKNGRLMPAVIEIEHSTGVTSGLTRMKGFKDAFPPFPTRFVVVAADEDRGKVVQEANRKQFIELNTKFFPYSAVEELYGLCQRRKIQGVTEEFLDSFMEPVVHE
jgi:type II restriction enzyme